MEGCSSMDRFGWEPRGRRGERYLVWAPTGQRLGLVNHSEHYAPQVWDTYDLLRGAYVGAGPFSDRAWAMAGLVGHVLFAPLSRHSISHGVWVFDPETRQPEHLPWHSPGDDEELQLLYHPDKTPVAGVRPAQDEDSGFEIVVEGDGYDWFPTKDEAMVALGTGVRWAVSQLGNDEAAPARVVGLRRPRWARKRRERSSNAR